MKRLLSLLVSLALVLSLPALAIPAKPSEQLDELEEIAYYLRSYALSSDGRNPVVKVTAPQLAADPSLFRRTVDGWLAGLNDPYCYFMTRQEYEEAFPGDVSYIGIGVSLFTVPTGVYLATVIEGGPAYKAGLRPGSQIVEIDGRDVADTPYAEASALLRGPEGSTVSIVYIEPGSVVRRQLSLVRDCIYIPDVTYAVDGNVGYIDIAMFGGLGDAADYNEIYNKIFPEAGVEYVIIDVRGNPGGQLDTLLEMLDCMIRQPDRLLLRMVTAWEREELLSTGRPDAFQPKKIVVLADEGSASCAEVFVGALQELGLAEAVGNTTYGKARAQYHIPLTYGDLLIFSISTIELQNIGEYQGVGIIPKHPVPRLNEAYPMPSLVPLDASRALFGLASGGARWLAVEQRLSELGYFHAEPDSLFDDYTLWCLNRFQASRGLPQTSYASAATLAALARAIEELALTESEYYTDVQMEYALGLCRP